MSQPFTLVPASWTDGARCGEVGPADWLWYAEKNERAYGEARTLCGSCPVRLPCLEYALEIDDQWGMWGGLTPGERKQLKRGGAA